MKAVETLNTDKARILSELEEAEDLQAINKLCTELRNINAQLELIGNETTHKKKS